MATIKAQVQDAASSAKAGIDKARATAGEKVRTQFVRRRHGRLLLIY